MASSQAFPLVARFPSWLRRALPALADTLCFRLCKMQQRVRRMLRVRVSQAG